MPKKSPETQAHERLWKTNVPDLPTDLFNIAAKHRALLALRTKIAEDCLGSLRPRRQLGGFLRYEVLRGVGPVAVYSVDIIL